MRKARIVPLAITQPPKSALAWTIGLSSAFVGIVGAVATFVANENSRLDRWAIEENARTERRELQAIATGEKLLAAKIDAVKRVQAAYSAFQQSRMELLPAYIDCVNAMAVLLSTPLDQNPDERFDMSENEKFRVATFKSNEKAFLLRNEVYTCALIFEFEEPNLEFLREFTAERTIKMMEEHVTAQAATIVKLNQELRKSLQKSGAPPPDYQKRLFKISADTAGRISGDFLKLDQEFEEIYTPLFKRLWTSISQEKGETSSP